LVLEFRRCAFRFFFFFFFLRKLIYLNVAKDTEKISQSESEDDESSDS